MLHLLSASALAADLAIVGAVVHPVASPPIASGVVLVEDGRITAVGPAAEVSIPEGARVLEAAVVTPGLVDALSTTGLTGILNHPPDQDHIEGDDPVQPALRALDAYDPWEDLVDWVRGHGVTTVNVGPSPGAVVGGRTAVVHTRSAPVDDVALVADGLVVFTLGDAPKWRFAGQGVGTRMGAAATIRQELARARDYAERRKLPLADRPEVDLGTEALADLLAKRRRALFVADRADDLLTALRIGREFGLDVVLAGAAEGWMVADELAEAGAPVIVGPVMTRGWTDGEEANTSYANAAKLRAAGVPVAFLSGYEGYVPKVRVVLWEAAIAAANGLGPEAALEALTLAPARILGVADRVGSLEVGKDADLVLFDGDPFEYTSHVCGVVVQGQVASETCR